jgi:DNA repair protein RecN (Recombination protein N)
VLEEIRISQLGVIDSSTLELGPGLTVITGETGAGKTMVVTALGLLLGARADSGAVRTGARSARVEGVVDASGLGGFAEAVDLAGGEVEDGRVVLARNLSTEGRSRAFVGGASVPVAKLAEVTEALVAVHGQSDQHRLLQPRAQREALDRFGGEAVAGLLATYVELHQRLGTTERELDEVVTSARERAREADVLRFGLGEVEAVDPTPGEDAELASEESRLGFADTLRTAAETAREALSSEDTTADDALATTSAARTALDGVREHDPEAGELADRLAEITYLLSDVAADVASYAARLETDPSRLAAVSERRAALTALTRKYGDTIDEVLAWAETSAARLLDLDGTDERIETLRAEQERLRGELATAAAALSTARTEAAGRLAEQVTGELGLLAMPDARLRVAVTQTEVEPTQASTGGPLLVGRRWLRTMSSGVDDVELLLAANVGSEPRPLHKGASGGELSRVMLALEVALAGTSPVPTFVFDEVDAGVGGAAAVEVGRRLAQLARTAQVLVVTHLPQVAAYADRHVLVEKSDDGSVTSSGLTVLDDGARERELSRMLAGLADSETALAHARELLEVAQEARALR